MAGILYVVSTPVGNLGDITRRAIETLKNVDVVACEDTRHTEKLMRYIGVHKVLVRYDEHTHDKAGRSLIDRLKRSENVALVTDAGTPGLSDPGGRLVRDVWQEGIRVVPIPGASSLLAGLAATGLGGQGFLFLGFLPRRPGRIRRALQEGFGLGKTMVIFESPFRIKNTLQIIEEMNPNVHVAVGRELTKIHEEFIQGAVKDVRNQVMSRPEKGEIVLIIEPNRSNSIEHEID